MKKLYYGVAYYDEYMPCDRLDEDIRMMKEAGINVVRIAESTWSTMEPRPGYFDYSHIDRVLDACIKPYRRHYRYANLCDPLLAGKDAPGSVG